MTIKEQDAAAQAAAEKEKGDLAERWARIERMRTWVNCPRAVYLERIALVSRWHRDRLGTSHIGPEMQAELFRLSDTRLGFVLFCVRGSQDGRRINPAMWLQALRASRRGQLALPWLADGGGAMIELRRRPHETWVDCVARVRLQRAIDAQTDFLERLMHSCPLVFDGMLVPPKEHGE